MALRFLEQNERALEVLGHAELWAQQVLQLCPCLCLQRPVLNPKDGFCRA